MATNLVIGMLASEDTIKTVAKCLRKYGAEQIVVDPVMISTSGSQVRIGSFSHTSTTLILLQLLPDSAVSAYLSDLFPIACIITPNLQEAKFLHKVATGTDFSVDSLEDAKDLAKELFKLGPKYVLLKGGHLPLSANYRRMTETSPCQIVADILYDGKEYYIVESKYIITKNTHGTGCTLACM
jgi:hydroxymethylpyrimidine kinase/phosphomethylpyrimidine kinase